jgi:isopentenyl-diphosphate delta-isomerase
VISAFFYEPVLGGDYANFPTQTTFAGKSLNYPLWISSMTGGTQMAAKINENLARAAHEFGLGMGLGSCRALLESNIRLADFDVRQFMPEQPLYANLGIAQVEQLLAEGKSAKFDELIELLKADGLIVHLNPIQEFYQPEGDKLTRPILETLEEFCEVYKGSKIVKEVGQGMGPKSLTKLIELDFDAIEFGAFGGTNFSQIENERSAEKTSIELALVGHDNLEMLDFYHQAIEYKKKYPQIIFSGGIKSSLDGFYLNQKTQVSSLYAQAGALLPHAMESYESLKKYLEKEIEIYKFAGTFLEVRDE